MPALNLTLAATKNTRSNAELAARRSASVSRGVAPGMPIYAAHAHNAEVWDVEGKRYIDFGGGIAVLNIGHRHPKVMARVEQQLRFFTHTCFMVTPYESYIELAEVLNRLAPIAGPKKTLLVTTGAEAIENAIKIARAATGRSDVITFSGAFHGRTLLAMAMSGKVVPYKIGFGPFPSGIWRLPFPVENGEFTVEACLDALERHFETAVEPARVAALVIEPVQGEGGIHAAPAAFLAGLRRVCDRHGIVLVADEVQTGFGRTGRWFAVEHAGIEPDLIVVAKSLAGGLPLAGVVGRAALMDAAEPGGLGGTYGGNPVSCAAALGVIEAIETEGLLGRATEQGVLIRERLREMAERLARAAIKNIRGLGAMVAFDVFADGSDSQPSSTAAKALTLRCLDAGLMILTCGAHGGSVRLLAPLTIDGGVLQEGLDILERCLAGEPNKE
jgi:4-aminobutyrate aminotransferase/(S)-3-amino-2-methylpropionate transaminase